MSLSPSVTELRAMASYAVRNSKHLIGKVDNGVIAELISQGIISGRNLSQSESLKLKSIIESEINGIVSTRPQSTNPCAEIFLDEKEVKAKEKCTCDIKLIMRSGCKCGGK